MRNFILLVVCLVFLKGYAQTKELKDISLDALITETQFSSDTPDAIEMIWWLPRSFWKVSFAQDPNASEADIQAIEDLLGDNELFAVINGKIGYFGGITYTPLNEILDEIRFFYKDEQLVIEETESISPDLTNFLSMMKPMMAKMLGPMGENLHFIVVKNNRTSNVLPIDANEAGILKVEMNEFSREVDLPLGSLLMEKKCPEDDKLLSGKWTYCPFHGKKLVSQ